MANLAKYFDTVINKATGIPIAGSVVTVTNADGSAVQLYLDDAGTVPITTPAINKVLTNSNGLYQFYVANGFYTLTFGTNPPVTITDVEIAEAGTAVIPPINASNFFANPSALPSTPVGITASAARTLLAVNNVDNTSDLNKPISTAAQTALNAKANLAGGASFTGAVILAMDPVDPNGAATKQYVDAVSSGQLPKGNVAVATTANITLSGLQTIDTYTTLNGDRVLVKNQTTQSQNGIYVASSGAWTRATDMDTWSEVPGASTFALGGSFNLKTGWACISPAGGTIGTTAITFVQTSAPGTYSATGGVTLGGSQFSLTPIAAATVVGNSSAGTAAPSGVSIPSVLGYTPANAAGQTFTGSGGIFTGSEAAWNLNAPAGSLRTTRLLTAGVIRWDTGADTSSESGSNIGSNYVISRFADGGSFLGTPFSISRSTGLVSLSSLSVAGGTTLASVTASGNIIGAIVAAPILQSSTGIGNGYARVVAGDATVSGSLSIYNPAAGLLGTIGGGGPTSPIPYSALYGHAFSGGPVTLPGNPTVALGAATKQYVDAGDAPVATNVMNYGAVADYNPTLNTGTDNSAAIVAAAALGKTLYFPAGQYLITGFAGQQAYQQLTSTGPGIVWVNYFGTNVRAGSTVVGGRTTARAGITGGGGFLVGGQNINKTGALLYAGRPEGSNIQPNTPTAHEHAVYCFLPNGTASSGSGTNRLTYTYGDLTIGGSFNLVEVGDFVGWDLGLYTISAMDGTGFNVTLVGGGAVSFPSNLDGPFRWCYDVCQGTCNVSGTTVTLVDGDEFWSFYYGSGQHRIRINGTWYAVTAIASPTSLTIGTSLGTVSNATFQMKTHLGFSAGMRIQSMFGGREENAFWYLSEDGWNIMDCQGYTAAGVPRIMPWGVSSGFAFDGNTDRLHQKMTADGMSGFGVDYATLQASRCRVVVGPSETAGYTGMGVMVNLGSGNVFRKVLVGAANSGGAGFRQLLIPN